MELLAVSSTYRAASHLKHAPCYPFLNTEPLHSCTSDKVSNSCFTTHPRHRNSQGTERPFYTVGNKSAVASGRVQCTLTLAMWLSSHSADPLHSQRNFQTTRYAQNVLSLQDNTQYVQPVIVSIQCEEQLGLIFSDANHT